MKANFTRDDISKLVDVNVKEDDQSELIEDEAVIAESEPEIQQTESDYSDYSYEDDYAYDSSYEDSDNKKKIFVIIGAVAALALIYFGYTSFFSSSSDSSPELANPGQAQEDTVKTPVLTISTNETRLISMKNGAVQALKTILNESDKAVIIEHIQITGANMVVQYISTNRGKIATSLRRLENSGFVEDVKTTDSKQLGASNQIRVTVNAQIKPLNQNLPALTGDINTNIASISQNLSSSSNLRSTEYLSLGSNMYLVAANGSRANIVSFLDSFRSSLQFTSMNKISVINQDRSHQNNSRFSIDARYTAIIPK